MAKYLVVGPSWVGDMVMAQSLFIKLHELDSSAIVDVIGPAWSAPILERMPEVRRAITLNLSHGQWGFGLRVTLGKKLRSEVYDKAIVLPRSWKSALVPFWANIKQRVGFHGEQRFLLLSERRKLDKKVLNQTVKRFVSLGLPLTEAYPPEAISFPRLRVDKDNQTDCIKSLQLDPNTPVVALMAGAEYGPAKQWPLDYFRELAEQLIERGYQLWVLGSARDRDDGEKIVQGLAGSATNLCGKTSLVDVVDLLAAAAMAVSNDSGLMHVAAAVGVRVHCIYGSSSEQFTPALTHNKTVHNLHLDCSPCFQRSCPLGHTHCLTQLKPQRIIKSICG